MEFPRLVVNAKAYPEAEGLGALRLARACSQVGQELGFPVGLAVPAVELAYVVRAALPGVLVLGQHCDAKAAGAATGHVTATMLGAAGATGSLVNHAERKVAHDLVAGAVVRLQEAGLWSLVCADGEAEVRALARLQPTALAIEPPELIGGDVSVTTADPAIVWNAVRDIRAAAPSTLPFCGAGIKGGADVAAARKLGCHGVLVASGVVKARDPAAAIRDLAAGL